jgi:hypothetical protein
MIVARRALVVAATVIASLVVPDAPRAEAKVLDVYAGLRTGAVLGSGSADLKAGEKDFFRQVRGPAMGFDLGAEVLGVNALINFTQVINGSGWSGTLTQFMLGFDLDLDLMDRLELRVGGASGIGLGTARPVDLPLSNDETVGKGLVAEAQGGLDYYVMRLLSVGVQGALGYHYFIDGPINAPTSSSQGTQFMLLLTARAHINPFR